MPSLKGASRSWLAQATFVNDLDADVYLPKSKHSWEAAREIKAERKTLGRAPQALPVDPEFERFFGSRMHDSWVIGVDRSERLLRVRLDSINADIFAIGLADVLGIERVQRQWPINLLFHDPVYVRCARHDSHGMLRFSDIRKMRSDTPQSGPQFLNDHFYHQDGRIQWVAQIWTWRKGSRLSATEFLMVDCSRATAEDQCGRALSDSFGPAVLPLWRDAMDGVDVGKESYAPWGQVSMESFLCRRMAAHGLSNRSFTSK